MCMIGCTTAIVVTLQFNLFTEMPFSFTLDTNLYLVVVCSAIGVTILGAYIPAAKFRFKQIAGTIKGM